MTRIVTSTYRPKRPPRKPKAQAAVITGPAIVTATSKRDRAPRHDINAHETRLRVRHRAERAAQKPLPPRIEKAAAYAVLAGHHDRRYPRLQTFRCNFALLFRCPTAAALATCDHLAATGAFGLVATQPAAVTIRR